MRIQKVVVGSLSTNCYLIYDNGEMIIVDPGAEADKILQEVSAAGCKVKYVINTHSHFDHTGANKMVLKKTGAQFLENLQEGEKIAVGDAMLEVILTPGHKEDAICLLGDGFMIAGDTLFEDGRGRTDLPGGDIKELKKTVEKLKEKLPPETVVYPGHGNYFTAKDHHLLSGEKRIRNI